MEAAELCLALYYTRENKHSFVPLIAAVESQPRLAALPLVYLDPEGSPDEELARLAAAYRLVVVAGVALQLPG